MTNEKKLIDKLYNTNNLSDDELLRLISSQSNPDYLFEKARETAKKIYGNHVYIRGLIEISNICKNDCYYCGIRKSNRFAERYRLTREQILDCCDTGYSLGFRTFVMQGGEDPYYTDDLLCGIISEIKERYKDSAVTLSLGERSFESYRRLREAGADRYLLRHETASAEHYGMLHPPIMSYENRMNSLRELKRIGFQTGCGFMVGSPHQTMENIVADLRFIKEFEPHMVGIGPFIPHHDTPFKNEKSGSPELTLRLLAIVRLLNPKVLLPATTALGSVSTNGRERGILAGANVIMPNLSPADVRKKYLLYDNKLFTGVESAESVNSLKKSIRDIGYEIVTARGDSKLLTGKVC